MHKLILSLLLLCYGPAIMAQDYIVTLQKDTIRGEVSIPLPKEYIEEVKIETSDSKNLYKVYQVLSVYADGNFYEPVKLFNKYRLMQVVEPGYLTLYLYRPDYSYDFSSHYLQKIGQEGIEVPNFSFRKVMSDFLQDCPSLVEKLEDKTYKKSDLQQIVKDYNSCIAERTDAIYEKEVSSTEDLKQTEKHPAVEIINEIQTKIDSESNAELVTLLNDIKTKLTNAQSIPGYLKSALKEQTSGMSEIENEVNDLLKSID